LIWNYKLELEKQGHDVKVTNTKDLSDVVRTVNYWKPDFVHLHYDVYADIMPYIVAPVRAMTSHYPYLDFPDKRNNYEWIFHKFAQNHSHVFSLSDRNNEHFKSFGTKEDLLWTWVYGVNSKMFSFQETPAYPDKTICLGKVEQRKQQAKLQTLNENIDFAGPYSDNNFQKNDSYLGVWTREQVYCELTNYANMILFSDGEAAPQVTAEALLAGIGLVVSKEASANLDESLPFIDVVDRSISDNELKDVIRKNRVNSIKHRKDIKQYGFDIFDLSKCVLKYTDRVKEIRESGVSI
jgi:hypothetical protein